GSGLKFETWSLGILFNLELGNWSFVPSGHSLDFAFCSPPTRITHGTLVAELRPLGQSVSFHRRRGVAGGGVAQRHRPVQNSNSFLGAARTGYGAGGRPVRLSDAGQSRAGHHRLRRGLRVVPDRLDHSQPDFSLPTDGEKR